MPERVHKTKYEGLRKKIEGGMPERVKKMKCGGGVREQFEGGGMPERITKTKCKGVLRKKLWGGYAGVTTNNDPRRKST